MGTPPSGEEIMPNEPTGYAKDLYELATTIYKSQNFVYAIRLLKRLWQLDDPFYTPFALALLAQSYNKIGREDLETEIFVAVTKLPETQQLLLNPGWVSACQLRAGNPTLAASILIDALKISPKEPTLISGLAEIDILGGRFAEASALIEGFRERPEPKFQILARMMRGVILALTQQPQESAKDFLWVGQFLISNGGVPPDMWDYRDLRRLGERLGQNAKTAGILFDFFTGKITFQEFSRMWADMFSTSAQLTA
jgi:tetratricopeptide (TPR) repeat protein